MIRDCLNVVQVFNSQMEIYVKYLQMKVAEIYADGNKNDMNSSINGFFLHSHLHVAHQIYCSIMLCVCDMWSGVCWLIEWDGLFLVYHTKPSLCIFCGSEKLPDPMNSDGDEFLCPLMACSWLPAPLLLPGFDEFWLIKFDSGLMLPNSFTICIEFGWSMGPPVGAIDRGD